MNYEIVKKANDFAEQLEGQGAHRTYMSSPVHYILWRFGINLRPPIIAGFWENVLINGFVFAIVFTLSGYVMQLLTLAPSFHLATIIIATITYGILLSYMIRRHRKGLERRKIYFPQW